ncbi:MAG: hypothetical protein IAF38_06860 [Bacteroidia bacterium]|nr:hypothetical protein [Bacteroidia bacterium]
MVVTANVSCELKPHPIKTIKKENKSVKVIYQHRKQEIIPQKKNSGVNKKKSHKSSNNPFESEILLYFLIFTVPPLAALMLYLLLELEAETAIIIILYSIIWIAVVFCLFYFIPLLWLSFLLFVIWNFFSFVAAFFIYGSLA